MTRRLRPEAGPGFTALEVEALFDSSPARSRVAIAHGLGGVASHVAPQAMGLAERLYSEDGDAYVRRFLCATLGSLGELRPALAEDLKLDADPVCRAVGRGQSTDVSGSPSLSVVAPGDRFFAARVLSPPIEFEPAPDGFVGARVTGQVEGGHANAEFVDCTESGAPTWACGKAAQTPR